MMITRAWCVDVDQRIQIISYIGGINVRYLLYNILNIVNVFLKSRQ
jgi:hypothetical protein